MEQALRLSAAWRRARVLEKLHDRSCHLSPAASTPASARRRILLVEDDEAVADAWLLVLELEGIGVTHASSGPQALALLTDLDEPIDLAIADFHLPGGMNGAEVISAIRRSQGSDLPAILVTGDSALANACSPQNVRRMAKPVDVGQLVAEIHGTRSAASLFRCNAE